MKDMIIMTPKDLLRIEYMRKVPEKKITQKETARLLELSSRHVRRLYFQFEKYGETGIQISCNRVYFRFLNFCLKNSMFLYGSRLSCLNFNLE